MKSYVSNILKIDNVIDMINYFATIDDRKHTIINEPCAFAYPFWILEITHKKEKLVTYSSTEPVVS